MARWLQDRRALAGVEFALVAPVLIFLTMSIYDVATVIVDKWRVTQAAGAIARIATAMAVTAGGANQLTIAQATTASTALFGVMPAWQNLSASRYNVTISSVVTAQTNPQCTTGCSYTANIAWSLGLQGPRVTRPCGVLTSVADGSLPMGSGLRADAFTAAPLIIVDVSYKFVPTVTKLFGAGFTMTESVYMAPRTGTNANWVRLIGPQAATVQCPGYTG